MASFGANLHLMRKRIAQSTLGYIRPHSFPDVKMSSAVMKPPNVLVYVPQNAAVCQKGCVSAYVENFLPGSRYVVYFLKHDQALKDPWMDNCRLLIVPSLHPEGGKTREFKKEEYSNLKTYFESGGKILSFCKEFTHHFGILTEKMSTNNKIQFIDKTQNCIIEGCINGWEKEALSVSSALKKDLGLNTSTILSANHVNSSLATVAVMCVNKNKGQLLHCAIPLVQFHRQCCTEMDKPEPRILLQWLFAQLGFEKVVDSEVSNLTYPCFLLSTDLHHVETFLSKVGHEVRGAASNLRFIKSKDFAESGPSNIKDSAYVPVLYSLDNVTSASSVKFDWLEFSKNLTSHAFGKIVLYSDVVTSTMDIVEPIVGRICQEKDFCITCIARQQTRGKGRGGNKWISPLGSAMFTIAFSISLQSHLGQRLSILQHLMTVAVVHGIRSIPELESLDLRVKWPNDIYIGNRAKIGGVLVKSTIFQDRCIATIGCGVNVSNEYPTQCINDVIKACNFFHRPLTCEEVLARAISHLEKLVAVYQSEGPAKFLSLYYKYWIHSGQKVSVCLGSKNETMVDAEVVGIDDCGFLRVTVANNSGVGLRELSLQPDTNSFDMTKNLIAMKS